MQLGETEYVVSLVTLNQGAAVELFDNELKKILENIADQQTDAEVPREIKLSVKIKPDGLRKQASVTLSIDSKMAPQKSATSQMWFGKSEGQPVAVQTDPNQGRLFDQPITGNNIRTFEKETK